MNNTENRDKGIALSSQAVMRLIASGSGDAALLYICMKKYGQDFSEKEAIELLGFSGARAAGAEAALKSMGLLDREADIEPRNGNGEVVYTGEEIAREIDKKGEFSHLLSETERRLGKKLTNAELVTLMGIYNDLSLPIEVLYLLLTYCVEDIERFYGKGRRPTVRQLEKEAYRWSNLELDTIEKAAGYIKRRKDAAGITGVIAGILGIAGRRLSRSEETYISKWIEWGFGSEEIESAYDKTILKTRELNWKYMNTILKNWQEKGLRTIDEIERGDKPVRAGGESERFEQEAIDWVRNYRKNKSSNGD